MSKYYGVEWYERTPAGPDHTLLDRALKLYDQGLSQKEVAKQLEVSLSKTQSLLRLATYVRENPHSKLGLRLGHLLTPTT